eukprot:Gb_22157 [translate_table: standard]
MMGTMWAEFEQTMLDKTGTGERNSICTVVFIMNPQGTCWFLTCVMIELSPYCWKVRVEVIVENTKVLTFQVNGELGFVVYIQWPLHGREAYDGMVRERVVELFLRQGYAVVSRSVHSTVSKKMAEHGTHSEPYYMHAEHMYNLDMMKHRKLKMTVAVWTAFGIESQKMAEHGTHSDPYYIHAEHMYGLDRMKHWKLKMTVAVWAAFGIGTFVPIFAVMFQQKKTASS